MQLCKLVDTLKTVILSLNIDYPGNKNDSLNGKYETTHNELKERALHNLGWMRTTHLPSNFGYFPIPYGCWCGSTRPWP